MKKRLVNFLVAVTVILIASQVMPLLRSTPTPRGVKFAPNTPLGQVVATLQEEFRNNQSVPPIIVDGTAYAIPVVLDMSPRAEFVFPEGTVATPEEYGLLSPGGTVPETQFHVLVLKHTDTLETLLALRSRLPAEAAWGLVVRTDDSYDDPFTETVVIPAETTDAAAQ